MQGAKRYTTLRILSIVARICAALYGGNEVARWIVWNAEDQFISRPTYSMFTSTAFFVLMLLLLSYICTAAADAAQDSSETKQLLLQLLENQSGEGDSGKPKDLWKDVEPSEGVHWKNKFRGWRPEKTPILFDDPDDYDLPRRVRRPIKK